MLLFIPDKPIPYDGTATQEDLTIPCVNNDYDCLRKFYMSRSLCDPVFGEVDTVHRPEFFVHLDECNVTVYYKNNSMTGLKPKILKN